MTSPDSTPGAAILIVDDEAPIRHALRRELRRKGFASRECEGPRQALAVIDEESFEPLAALLDYYMPGMDGIDLARELRQRMPDLPVLMITAGHIEGDEKVAAALADGTLQDLIRKPWARDKLHAAIDRITGS